MGKKNSLAICILALLATFAVAGVAAAAPNTTATPNVPHFNIAPNVTVTNWTKQNVTVTFQRSDASYTVITLVRTNQPTIKVKLYNGTWSSLVTMANTTSIVVYNNSTVGRTFYMDVNTTTTLNVTFRYYSVNSTNVSEQAKYLTIRVDKVKPLLSIHVYDSDGDGFPEINELVKIRYNITDVAPAKVVLLWHNDTSGQNVTVGTQEVNSSGIHWYNFTPSLIGDYYFVAYDQAGNNNAKKFHIFDNYLAYAVRSSPKTVLSLNVTNLATLDLMNRSEVNVTVIGGTEIKIPVNYVQRTIIPGTKSSYTLYVDNRANTTIRNYYQTCVVYNKGAKLDLSIKTKEPAKGIIIIAKLNDTAAENKIDEFAKTFSIKNLVNLSDLENLVNKSYIFFIGAPGCGKAVYDQNTHEFTGIQTWGNGFVIYSKLVNTLTDPNNLINFSKGVTLSQIPGYNSMAAAAGLASLSPGAYMVVAISRDGNVTAVDAAMPIIVINGTKPTISSTSVPVGGSFKLSFPPVVNRTSVLMLKDVMYNGQVTINATQAWNKVWRFNLTYDNRPLRELIYYKNGEPKHTKIWIPVGMGRGAYIRGNNLTITTSNLDPGEYDLYVFAQEVGGRLYYAGVMHVNLTSYYGVNVSVSPTTRTVEPGQNGTFYISITNTGNVNDTYTFRITGNVNTYLNVTSVTVPAHGTKVVQLNASASVPGTYPITVTVYSPNASAEVSMVLKVVKVVGISADYSLRIVKVNEPAQFNVTVKNIGLATHTYTLSVSSSLQTVLNGTATSSVSFTLSPGQTKLINVKVTPTSATTYTLTATASTVVNGITRSASLKLTVIAKPFYAVQVMPNTTFLKAELMQHVAYKLTVKNTGNVQDNYTISVVAPYGVQYSLSSSKVTVSAGSSTDVYLYAWGNLTGNHSIVVTVASETNPAVTSVTQLTLGVVRAVSLTSNALSASALGTSASIPFTLKLKNPGVIAHNYVLKCYNGTSVVYINGAKVATSSFTLSPGSETSINLTVTSSVGEHSILVSASTTTAGGVKEYDNLTLSIVVSKVNVYGVSLTVNRTLAYTNVNRPVSYLITVTNTGNAPDTVNLVVLSPYGTLNTTSVSLNAGQSKPVLLTVTIPTSGMYKISVVATSSNDPSKTDSVTVKTYVRSYGVILTSDTLSQTRNVNETAIYTLKLKNIGNVVDSYTVTISSSCSYSLSGYNVSFNPTLGAYVVSGVKPGESRILTLKLYSSSAGTYYANVTAVSQGDTSKVDYVNVTAKFTPTPVYSFEIKATPMSKTTEVYDKAVYTIEIKNTGNQKDTYTLTASNGALEKSTVTLDPGEAAFLAYTVSYTTPGIYTSTITVTSSRGISKVATVYTKVVSAVSLTVSPGSVTKNVGSAAKFTITIKNTGITAHTYIISTSSSATTSLSANQIYLEPGDSAKVTLTVNSSTAGIYPATVTAYVSGTPAKSASTTVYTLFIVAQVHGVSIKAYPVVQVVPPNTTAKFLITISNVGNVNDVYTVKTSSGTLSDGTSSGTTLSESIAAGTAKTLTLTASFSSVGTHTIKISAASSYVSGNIIVKVIVTGLQNATVEKSVVEESALVNAVVKDSMISTSYIDPSTIQNSQLTNCIVRNSIITNTVASNMEFYNATVNNGIISSGTIVVNGVKYVITKSINIHNIEVAYDSKSIAGLQGKVTSVTSTVAGITVDILNSANYVGANVVFHKSTIPPAGVAAPSTSNVAVSAPSGSKVYTTLIGNYINVSVSGVKMQKATLVVTFDPAKVPSGYKPKLFTYDKATGKWVELSNVRVVGNKIMGETSHFSIFAVIAVKIVTAPCVSGVVGGGGLIVPTPTPEAKVVLAKYTPKTPISISSSQYTTITIPTTANVDVLMLKLKAYESGNYFLYIAKVKKPAQVPAIKYPTYTYLEMFLYNVKGQKVEATGTVEFRVAKTWLDGYNKNDVVLMQYHGKWRELTTKFIKEDSKYCYYEAEVPSFSIYAIAVKAPVVTTTTTVVTTTVPTTVVTTTTTTTPPPVKPSYGKTIWIVVAIAIIVIVIVAAAYALRRR